MKSFLFILLLAVAVSAGYAQQPQSPTKQGAPPAQSKPGTQPAPTAQPEQPAQPEPYPQEEQSAQPAPQPAEEPPLPGAAPKPGHPLDPADVQTLISKPATSVSPAARSGYAPQVYYYYPQDVPLFGYPYGYPHGLRTPRSFHTNQPLLQIGPGGPNLIVPVGPRHKPKPSALAPTTPAPTK